MAYTKSELVKAIRNQCSVCNDTWQWTLSNDCTGRSCPLYPYRPGDGPGHADQMKVSASRSAAAKARFAKKG